MERTLINGIKSLKQRIHSSVVGSKDPRAVFHSDRYLRINSRRLEHLASLRIPVAGKSVLEVGAGIGDHSHYYLDRDCRLTITEVRDENLKIINERYPGQVIHRLDMEHPTPLDNAPFDIVHCYGLLYHLSDPRSAIQFLSDQCRESLFLETSVSFDAENAVNNLQENATNPSQSSVGMGCRPSRTWLYNVLKEHFKYVYVPLTQPNDPEFPLDWTAPDKHPCNLSRAVYIASRIPLAHDVLSSSLQDHQRRHE